MAQEGADRAAADAHGPRRNPVDLRDRPLQRLHDRSVRRRGRRGRPLHGLDRHGHPALLLDAVGDRADARHDLVEIDRGQDPAVEVEHVLARQRVHVRHVRLLLRGGERGDRAGRTAGRRPGRLRPSSPSRTTSSDAAAKAFTPFWGVEAWHCLPFVMNFSQRMLFSAISISEPSGAPWSGTSAQSDAGEELRGRLQHVLDAVLGARLLVRDEEQAHRAGRLEAQLAQRRRGDHRGHEALLVVLHAPADEPVAVDHERVGVGRPELPLAGRHDVEVGHDPEGPVLRRARESSPRGSAACRPATRGSGDGYAVGFGQPERASHSTSLWALSFSPVPSFCGPRAGMAVRSRCSAMARSRFASMACLSRRDGRVHARHDSRAGREGQPAIRGSSLALSKRPAGGTLGAWKAFVPRGPRRPSRSSRCRSSSLGSCGPRAVAWGLLLWGDLSRAVRHGDGRGDHPRLADQRHLPRRGQGRAAGPRVRQGPGTEVREARGGGRRGRDPAALARPPGDSPARRTRRPLPIRETADANAKTVYRLRFGQLVKVVGRIGRAGGGEAVHGLLVRGGHRGRLQRAGASATT